MKSFKATLCMLVLVALASSALGGSACQTRKGAGRCMQAHKCADKGGENFFKSDGATGCIWGLGVQWTCCYTGADDSEPATSAQTPSAQPSTTAESGDLDTSRACSLDGRTGFCTRSHRGCLDMGGERFWGGSGATGCDFDQRGRMVCCIGAEGVETTEPTTGAETEVEPDTSEPEITDGGDVETETTETETTEPEMTDGGDVETETTEPEMTDGGDVETEIETTEPETTEPEIETTEPETTEPEIETTEPETTTATTEPVSTRGAKTLTGLPTCTFAQGDETLNGVCIHKAECWDAEGTPRSSSSGAVGCGPYDAMVMCCTGDLKAPVEGSVGAHVEAKGCSSAVIGGLAAQLAQALNCELDDADKLVKIDDLDYVTLTDAAAVSPFLQKGARDKLKKVVDTKKKNFRINSSLRSLPQQLLLWTWKTACAYTAVATPGNSNHQGGKAIDVSVVSRPTYKTTLESNGWKWFGAGDKPHFTYTAGKDLRSKAVLAFQKTWNVNHPEDKLKEDSQWGKEVARRVMMSPAGGFAKALPGCADMELASLSWGNGDNVAIASGESVVLEVADGGLEADVVSSDGVAAVDVASLDDSRTSTHWNTLSRQAADDSATAYQNAQSVEGQVVPNSREANLNEPLIDMANVESGDLEDVMATSIGDNILLQLGARFNYPNAAEMRADAAEVLAEHRENTENAAAAAAMVDTPATPERADRSGDMSEFIKKIPTKPLEMIPMRPLYRGVFKKVLIALSQTSKVVRVQGFGKDGKLVYRDFENAKLNNPRLELRSSAEEGTVSLQARYKMTYGMFVKGMPARFYTLVGNKWVFIGEKRLNLGGNARIKVPVFVAGTRVFKVTVDGLSASRAQYCDGPAMYVVIDSQSEEPRKGQPIATSSPLMLHTDAAPQVRKVVYKLLRVGDTTPVVLGESTDPTSRFELMHGADVGDHVLLAEAYDMNGEALQGVSSRIVVTQEVDMV